MRNSGKTGISSEGLCCKANGGKVMSLRELARFSPPSCRISALGIQNETGKPGVVGVGSDPLTCTMTRYIQLDSTRQVSHEHTCIPVHACIASRLVTNPTYQQRHKHKCSPSSSSNQTQTRRNAWPTEGFGSDSIPMNGWPRHGFNALGETGHPCRFFACTAR